MGRGEVMRGMFERGFIYVGIKCGWVVWLRVGEVWKELAAMILLFVKREAYWLCIFSLCSGEEV